MSLQALPENDTGLWRDLVTSEAAKEGAGNLSDECPDGGLIAWTQVAGVCSSNSQTFSLRQPWLCFGRSIQFFAFKNYISDLLSGPNPCLDKEVLNAETDIYAGFFHIFQHLGDYQ